MRFAFPVVGIVLVIATASVAQTGAEVVLNEKTDALYEAIRQGDAEAVAAFFHEDGVLGLNSGVVFGRANIVEAGREDFAEGGPPMTFTRQATTVRAELAVVRGVSELRGNRMHTMITFTKEGAEWLVASLQYAPM